MGKKYLYAHVTPREEDVFDRYTPIERKVMYARRVLQRNPIFSLYHKLYKQIKESI